MDFDIKTQPVRILGFSLYFSERVAQDVLDSNAFAEEHKTDDGGFDSDLSLMVWSAKVVHDALKDSIKSKMPWQAKKFKEESLLNTLRPTQLMEYVSEILDLEGMSKKKAEVVTPSDESSPGSSSKKSSGSKTRKASESESTEKP